jgi:BlaI family transcriptional regulator, penicillinase repressor
MEPMARIPQDVTDAELAVLEVLWDQGPCSRRQIADVLYPGGQAAHYTTVQKLLERLQKKGHVACHAKSPVRTFAATVSRDALISRRLLDVADKLCEGSLTPLLMNLVRATPLAEGELDELRRLVKELSQKQRRKRDSH